MYLQLKQAETYYPLRREELGLDFVVLDPARVEVGYTCAKCVKEQFSLTMAKCCVHCGVIVCGFCSYVSSVCEFCEKKKREMSEMSEIKEGPFETLSMK
jgi:hypothetical protein